MKKIIIFLLILISFESIGQVKQKPVSYGVQYRRVQADSAIRMPTVTVGIKDLYAGYDTAQFYYNKTDSSVYVYTGSAFRLLRGASGSGSTPTWQQTLTAGSTLTGNNTVDGGGFDFKLYSAAGNILFNTKANSTSYGARLYLNGDSAWYIGNNKVFVKTNVAGNILHIDPGQTSSDTSTFNKILASKSSDGESAWLPWSVVGGGGGVTGSGTQYQMAYWNGSSVLTGSTYYTVSNNASYANLTIGASGSISSYLGLRDPGGTFNYLSTDGGPLTITGSSTYGTVNISSLSNSRTAFNIAMNNSGYNLIGVDGLMSNSDTVHLSNTQGVYDIQRTFGYQNGGTNGHGYTDQTNWKRSTASFNSFSSFVHFGNNSAHVMGHYASFQSQWQKDSLNTTPDVYDFVSATSYVTGGSVTRRSGLYIYDIDTTGGGNVGTQYGVRVSKLKVAGTNWGVYIDSNYSYFGGNVGIGTITPASLFTVGDDQFQVASTGIATLGKVGGTTGKISFKGTTSGTVDITTAAAAGTWTLTLPTSGGTTGYILQTDGAGVTSWVAPSGGGIGGSTGATDNRLLRSDGTGGATLQNSGITVDDNADMTGVRNISATNKIQQSGTTADITSFMNTNSGNLASTTATNPGIFWFNGGAGSLYGAAIGYHSGYGTELITGDATSFFWSRGGGNSTSNFTQAMTLNSSDQLLIPGGIYVGSATTAPTTKVQVAGRFASDQGADIASANNLTLGSDGNSFEITGTTQINLIANTGWVNGSVIHLIFTSTPTVKNGQTTSGANITILLAGAADFSATADDILTLMLCEVGGTQAWREVSRSVN